MVYTHLTVHVEVARTDGDEGSRVDGEQGGDVEFVDGVRRLHRQTDARLAVAAHSDDGQRGEAHCDDPAQEQDPGRLTQPQALRQVDRVPDGVPPLHRDDGQCEDRVASGEDGEEACHLTATLVLPRDGEVEVDTLCMQVYSG